MYVANVQEVKSSEKTLIDVLMCVTNIQEGKSAVKTLVNVLMCVTNIQEGKSSEKTLVNVLMGVTNIQEGKSSEKHWSMSSCVWPTYRKESLLKNTCRCPHVCGQHTGRKVFWKTLVKSSCVWPTYRIERLLKNPGQCSHVCGQHTGLKVFWKTLVNVLMCVANIQEGKSSEKPWSMSSCVWPTYRIESLLKNTGRWLFVCERRSNVASITSLNVNERHSTLYSLLFTY